MKAFIKQLILRVRGEVDTRYLIEQGLHVGGNFHRMQGVIIDPGHCWLVSIGDNVTLAPRVHILAHDASTKKVLNYTKIGLVTIGNNVFVGADSVILPGVRIGDNVVIGANSTVTKDIPKNSVYAGSPARFICSFDDYVSNHRLAIATSMCFDESYTKRGNINKEQKEQMKEYLLGNKTGYVK